MYKFQTVRTRCPFTHGITYKNVFRGSKYLKMHCTFIHKNNSLFALVTYLEQAIDTLWVYTIRAIRLPTLSTVASIRQSGQESVSGQPIQACFILQDLIILSDGKVYLSKRKA